MNLKWDCKKHLAAIYRSKGAYLHAIKEMDSKPFSSFFGLEKEIEILCKNTESFLCDKGGVNTLLWGARGCGKSSLIKALLLKYSKQNLRILQLLKEDLEILPEIFDFLREKKRYKFIIFCDDLSFEESENYKILKTFLEGSLESLPKNVLIYATSNRRHLLPEFYEENEIFGAEGNEDKIALSERFPLSIGFYPQGVREYLEILERMFETLPQDWEEIKKKALNFATKKGSKNPRIATQFYKLYTQNLHHII